MSFGIEEAVKTANQLIFQQFSRHLTDVETVVLRGSWEKLEYDQIAAQNKYATSYISQDAAPKLWKMLSTALGEKVKKSNFKAALKRSWEDSLNQSANQLNVEAQSAIAQETTTQRQKTQTASELASQSTVQTTNARDVVSKIPEFSQASSLFSHIYIERQPVESMCCEAIAQPGALIRIKAPRLMGKTALANYLLAQLTTAGYRTVNLSFELADRNVHLTNLNKFLRWLCLNICRELGQNAPIDELWDEEGIGAKVSCTAYFEEVILNSEQPLVLCLDNVDLLFPHPEVYEDFFGLLRSWYEKSRNRPIWKKLHLVIVHATDVYIRLNINQSPFNVGLSVELPEFSETQVQDFARQSGLAEHSAQIQALMHWVGGHPYLLEQAFTYLKSHLDSDIQTLLAKDTGIMKVYRGHLKNQWVALQENPELMNAFVEVVNSESPARIDPMLAYQLQSMGLVKSEGGRIVTRCKLYREYFRKHVE